MRLEHTIFLAALCMSCSSVNQHSSKAVQSVDQHSSKAVQLPKLNLDGVHWDDGLTQNEAAKLASEYFPIFVSSCGMPDNPPQTDGHFWSVTLLVGIAGSPSGRFLFAKDGSEVLIEPPIKGFRSETRRLLKSHNITYE